MTLTEQQRLYLLDTLGASQEMLEDEIAQEDGERLIELRAELDLVNGLIDGLRKDIAP